MDTKKVCRAIESAIGFPDGLPEDIGSWLGLQMHADGPRSPVFTIHALAADSVVPADPWTKDVVAVLAKHGIRKDSVQIQQLNNFEDVAKQEARPCSALLGFLNSQPELVAKLRNQPTTLIAAEISRKERLLLWFLFSDGSADEMSASDDSV